MMVRTDPDMETVLEVSEEKRDNVRHRLEELLRKERENADSRPSLLKFIRYKAGLLGRTESEEAKHARGRPFPLIYKTGHRFSCDRECYTQYDRQWVAGYAAYLYYRLHKRLFNLARAVWQLARYIVTGSP